MQLKTQISPRAHSKHALMAEALANDIESGKYAVGDLLPSEAELSTAFGVSRHTVRMALRTLHELGLVQSHQGLGTRVQKEQVTYRYTQSFDTMSDLLQFTSSTRTKILERSELVAQGDVAQFLSCKPGEHWCRVRTLRFATHKSPLAVSEIFIPRAYAAVLADVPGSTQPLSALLESRFHEPIVEILQDIAATNVQGADAADLRVAPDTACLAITRRYIGRGGKVLEVARSLYTSDSFRYSMRVRLQRGA